MKLSKRKVVRRILTNECHLKGIDGIYIEDACEHADDMLLNGGQAVNCILAGVEVAEKLQRLSGKRLLKNTRCTYTIHTFK